MCEQAIHIYEHVRCTEFSVEQKGLDNQTKPIYNYYFIKSKHNIIKIYLATIQASEDIKRVGKPKGIIWLLVKYGQKAFL